MQSSTYHYMIAIALSLACLNASATDALNPRTITVQGETHMQITPNRATLQVAVETTSPTAKQAVQGNSDKMTNVVNTLKKQLGKEDKISTSGFNLTPLYEYDKDTQRSLLSGYQVINVVTVNTKQLDQLGVLLDAVTQAGANRVDSLQFSHDEWHSYEQQAMAKAVDDAQQTAEILAQAAHVTLGAVLQIQPQQNGEVPMRHFAMAKAEGSANIPVEPGELTVNAHVAVTYRIE